MIKIELNKDKPSTWHSNIKIINGNSILYLSQNPSGCGQMILHNWAWTGTFNEVRESLLHIINIIQNKGGKIDYLPYLNTLDIGSIITTVGEAYYHGKKVLSLEEVGFKCISEYRNPRHSKTYKQKLYIWTIN